MPVSDLEVDVSYPAVVKAAAPTEASTGTPGMALTFEIQDHDGNRLAIMSRTLWITPKTVEEAKKTLRRLGATDADFANRDFFYEPDKLVGAECSVTLQERESEKGGTFKEIRWINSRIREASSTAVDRMHALLGGGAPSRDDDGEIPFSDVPFNDEVPF